jgi:glycosyltransferase involved in cell wall biosynthesis
MTITTFMAVTNPEEGCYPYLQAIESHLLFSDEFILIDGGSSDGSLEKIQKKFGEDVKILHITWPQGYKKWTWEQFALTWNAGYKAATGDWVVAGECDHVFEHNEAMKMRIAIERHGLNRRVLFADKLVSSTWYRWQGKSKFAYALNKGQYDDMGYGMDLRKNQPQDLASPIIINGFDERYSIPTGELLTNEHGHSLGVRFLNYDKTFQTAEQIKINRRNANWAWNHSCLTELELCPKWKEKKVLDDVVKRMVYRYETSKINLLLKDHPISMRSKIINLPENALGYSLFEKV